MGGNDWIDPRGGNDLVIEGPGDDFVRGSAGADVVKGGLGKDYLVGGPGPDHLFGADGADRCLNTRDNIAGNDSASGGPGFDTGTRNPGDTFVGIERTTTVAPYCPPAPPRPL
jgi:hemolysin type calcium-binding protein